jgi:protein phosphatase
MTSSAASPILFHGQTHAGLVRDDNQDAIRTSHNDDERTITHGHLYGIADGMGGYDHGGVASELALQMLFNTFYAGKPRQSAQNLRNGIRDANLGVYQAAQRIGTRMGTTLTAINLAGNRAHVAHVGDSRAYLIRDGKATCLTNDHTPVGDLVRSRILGPEKVRTHAMRSKLNKSLGIELFVQPDISQVELRQGDVLILCTDGVWAVVQDDEFAQLVVKASDIAEASQNLIDLALERESDDNVSALAISIKALTVEATASAPERGWRLPFFRNRVADQSGDS